MLCCAMLCYSIFWVRWSKMLITVKCSWPLEYVVRHSVSSELVLREVDGSSSWLLLLLHKNIVVLNHFSSTWISWSLALKKWYKFDFSNFSDWCRKAVSLLPQNPLMLVGKVEHQHALGAGCVGPDPVWAPELLCRQNWLWLQEDTKLWDCFFLS